MATLYTEQGRNIRKTWVYMSGFFLVLIALGWYGSYYFNNPVFVYLFAIVSIVMNITSYWYSDKIVLSMYKAQEIKREQYPELYTVVENLSITAGLPMPKVFVIPDDAPNAFATGRDKKHAAVAVTSGCLRILNKNELEGVIAHELSHIGNRDTLIATVVVVLVGFVSIFVNFFTHNMWFGGRGRDREGGMNPIILIIGLLFVILSPIIATLLQLAISRKREYLADASGALLTRYPEGLASALEKISAYARPMAHANEATAHLFIANPLPKVSRLFATHPPIVDRVRILRQMAV